MCVWNDSIYKRRITKKCVLPNWSVIELIKMFNSPNAFKMFGVNEWMDEWTMVFINKYRLYMLSLCTVHGVVWFDYSWICNCKERERIRNNNEKKENTKYAYCSWIMYSDFKFVQSRGSVSFVNKMYNVHVFAMGYMYVVCIV